MRVAIHRALRDQMLKKECGRLIRLVNEFVLSRGGRIKPYFAFTLEIATIAGPLSITPFGNWIACRFDDPHRAAASLGIYGDFLNKFSGKWNWHFGRETALCAFGQFRAALESILPGRENCPHLPQHLYSWIAHDGVLVICCRECHSVLKGQAADLQGENR